MAGSPSFYQDVYRLVRRIPRGRVMTYGQVATLLGSPRAARAVGYALAAAGAARVPWQRVINARGQISVGGRLERPAEQRRRLEAEQVRFDRNGCCDLPRLRWWPPGHTPSPALVAWAPALGGSGGRSGGAGAGRPPRRRRGNALAD